MTPKRARMILAGGWKAEQQFACPVSEQTHLREFYRAELLLHRVSSKFRLGRWRMLEGTSPGDSRGRAAFFLAYR